MGFGPQGPGFGLFLLLIVAALVVLAILALMRRHDRDGGHSRQPDDHQPFDANGALTILNERLARGEIEPEDYRARRSLLEKTASVSHSG